MDTYFGNQTVYDMPSTEFIDFVKNNFEGGGFDHPSRAAQETKNLYKNELALSTELAYQTYLADCSLLCGNIALISTMSKSFTSPVYASVGIHSPSRPFPTFQVSRHVNIQAIVWTMFALLMLMI